MLDPSAWLTVVFVALALFALIGVVGARRLGAGQRDRYLTARRSQGPRGLALSFFASALGTWILISPPEVGTFGGLLGISGYASGQALAIAAFAYLGPRVAAWVPEGSTILEFVRRRFGRLQQLYVGGISVLYMFVFLTAELTAIGLVGSLVAGAGPVVPIVAVAAATAAYTAYGGLPASLATDRLQAWLIVGLVAAAAAAIAAEVSAPGAALRAGGAGRLTGVGAETAVVLVIAVVAANLFHQGLWQRVWAATDGPSLARGALGGGILIFPVVLLMGLAGALAQGAGLVEVPSLAFFGLLTGLPPAALVAVVALAVALVASTTDTLQNALASLVAVHVARGRVPLGGARLVTVALTVPAAAIAVQGVSVLRLFLVADLLAATVAVPVFLGLWRRATPAGALAGSVTGLLGVVALGWIGTGSAAEGVVLLTLPHGPTLGPFLVAPLASGIVAVAVSMVAGRAGNAAARPPGPGTGGSSAIR